MDISQTNLRLHMRIQHSVLRSEPIVFGNVELPASYNTIVKTNTSLFSLPAGSGEFQLFQRQLTRTLNTDCARILGLGTVKHYMYCRCKFCLPDQVGFTGTISSQFMTLKVPNEPSSKVKFCLDVKN